VAIRNLVTERLEIEHPILLAPMDLVAGGQLAAAVTHAGGLGLLGGGYGDPDWIESEWAQAGNARIGCGFITWSLANRPEALTTALAHRPAAIMLSFGDPTPFAAQIRASGAKLIYQVQSVRQARQATQAGADVIVAQGAEAGGHGMSAPLFSLLPQVVDACPQTPVVAAGGIADGRGLAAALMLGAEGALIGTRFYASVEADGAAEAKQRIVAAGDGDSVRSVVFDIARANRWPEGYTGRCLRNGFAQRWLGREDEMAAQGEAVAREYAAARERRDFDVAAVIAGEACGLIHDIPPAGEIVARIVAQAERLLSRG
jgi:nitronate monooxygenase